MTTTEGQFLDLNAQKLVKLHPNLHKLRPGVVRRSHPEPDRTHVEGANALNPQPLPEAAPAATEPAEVVTRKRKARAKVTADTRAVAVARVEKLIAAGNPAAKAIASVAKELGVSLSAVQNWRTAARKNGAAEKPSKKAARRAAPPPSPGYTRGTPVPTAVLGEQLLELLTDAVGPIVRVIVREEIRRMLA